MRISFWVRSINGDASDHDLLIEEGIEEKDAFIALTGMDEENIIMALGIKGVCLLLGVFGIVNMWLAIFADIGVMVLAVLNAIRAMYIRKI